MHGFLAAFRKWLWYSIFASGRVQKLKWKSPTTLTGTALTPEEQLATSLEVPFLCLKLESPRSPEDSPAACTPWFEWCRVCNLQRALPVYYFARLSDWLFLPPPLIATYWLHWWIDSERSSGLHLIARWLGSANTKWSLERCRHFIQPWYIPPHVILDSKFDIVRGKVPWLNNIKGFSFLRLGSKLGHLFDMPGGVFNIWVDDRGSPMPRTQSPRLLPDKLLSCGASVGEVHPTSCQLLIDVSHYPRVTIVVIILVVLAIFRWHEEPNAFRWLWAASWMM